MSMESPNLVQKGAIYILLMAFHLTFLLVQWVLLNPLTLINRIQFDAVVVHLRATGDGPILKQAKFKIAGTDKFAKFVYVNNAFSPNPDGLVIDLYNSFGFHGKLVVSYACSMAWGYSLGNGFPDTICTVRAFETHVLLKQGTLFEGVKVIGHTIQLVHSSFII